MNINDIRDGDIVNYKSKPHAVVDSKFTPNGKREQVLIAPVEADNHRRINGRTINANASALSVWS